MRKAALALSALLALAAVPANSAPELRLRARAAVLMDASTGRVLYAKRPDVRMAPASLAKMMTAIVAVEHLAPTDPVPITRAATRVRSDTMKWPDGREFPAEHLLYGLLLQSSNGAAVALAERVAGTVPAFMEMVNRRARALGAKRTRLVSPNGLDEPGQYSTARDLAVIARAFMRVPRLAVIAGTKEIVIPWRPGETATVKTFNSLLYQYPEATGVKTGFTRLAGYCLAGSATRNGVSLITVVLNDRHRFTDTKRLLEHGFSVVPAPSPSAPASRTAERAAPRARQEPVARAGGGIGAWVWPLLTLYVARVSWVRYRRIQRRRARA